jgi:hypothetical protein
MLQIFRRKMPEIKKRFRLGQYQIRALVIIPEAVPHVTFPNVQITDDIDLVDLSHRYGNRTKTIGDLVTTTHRNQD